MDALEQCQREMRRLRAVVREYESDKVHQAAPELYQAVQWALSHLSNPNAIDPVDLGFKLLRALKAAGADDKITIPACAGIIKDKELKLLQAAPDLLEACKTAMDTLTWAKEQDDMGNSKALLYAAQDLTDKTSKLYNALQMAEGK
jgi:hypothetical protein